MSKWLLRRFFRRVEMGSGCGRRGCACCLTAMIATPLPRPPELASVVETAARRRSQHHARRSSGFRPATAPSSAYRHYPARGAGDRARRHRRSRLVRLERPAIHALADALWLRAASKPVRSTFAAMARRGRAATSPISASSRTISPISSRWSARPTPTAPLTLLGHSAGGGFALRVAGSPIQNLFDAHRAAGALSRLRRADQPAEFRRLGQRRYSALHRP